MTPVYSNSLSHSYPARKPTEFQLRVADFDRYGHVNNAIHWQAVEDGVAHHPTVHRSPYRAIVEHVGAITTGDEVMLRTQHTDTGLHLHLEVGGIARTLAHVARLDRPREDALTCC